MDEVYHSSIIHEGGRYEMCAENISKERYQPTKEIHRLCRVFSIIEKN